MATVFTYIKHLFTIFTIFNKMLTFTLFLIDYFARVGVYANFNAFLKVAASTSILQLAGIRKSEKAANSTQKNSFFLFVESKIFQMPLTKLKHFYVLLNPFSK